MSAVTTARSSRHQHGRDLAQRRKEKKEVPLEIFDTTKGRKFKRGRFLGKGGFAKCYELHDSETGERFAGKIVNKATLTKHRAKEKLTSEVKIHRGLKHRHIVGFHRFFEDKDNVYILLELCSNHSMMELHKRRGALTEPEARYYTAQILSATKFMHDSKVIHRDLKLGNLFLNGDMEIKVGDYGLATTVSYDGERKKTLCGTPNYIAPEILEGKNGHSFEVDIWSIGCILYTMLVGKPPFETSNLKATYKKIKTNDYRIPSSAKISDDAKNLIRALLHSDPSKRPVVAEIQNHPFFTRHFVPTSLPQSAVALPPTFDQPSEKQYGSSSSGYHRTAREPLRSLNRQGDSKHSSKPASTKGAKDALFPSAQDTRPRSSTTRFQRDAVRPAPPPPPAQFVPDAAPASKDTALGRARALSTLKEASEPFSLSAIHKKLKSVKERHDSAAQMSRPQMVPGTDSRSGIWISKWVDYSNKYGLGYTLRDGSVGVLFNDSTKMILSADEQHVEFVERESNGNDVTLLTLDSFPKTLEKKVTLLKFFQGYMNTHLQNGGDAATVLKTSSMVHVKKWIRTKHAIIFRLNNGVFQINFFDHSKLIINTPEDIVTYINKERVSSTYYLDDVAKTKHRCVEELSSRLSYATDVIEHMMKSTREKAARK